jgi:signal recognition particle subunit SEC65
MNHTNSKILQIAQKLNYTPIANPDKKRPYVLKVKKNNKYYILKTRHFADEINILKILNKQNITSTKIPKLYKYSKNYIIEDYLPGKSPSINKFKSEIVLVRKSISSLHKSLNKKNILYKYAKTGKNNHTSDLSSSKWLVARLKYWFSNKQSSKIHRFNILQTRKSIQYLKAIKTKTIINFGAFSKQHLRIYKNTVGVFDFGGHIRFAPAEYDWAYLWWSYFLDEATRHSFLYWVNFTQYIANHSRNQNEFYACIIERLAGIAKDLTHQKDVKNDIYKTKKMKILRSQILNHILQNQ